MNAMHDARIVAASVQRREGISGWYRVMRYAPTTAARAALIPAVVLHDPDRLAQLRGHERMIGGSRAVGPGQTGATPGRHRGDAGESYHRAIMKTLFDPADRGALEALIRAITP